MPSFSLNSLLSPRLDPSAGSQAIQGAAGYMLDQAKLGEQVRSSQVNEQEANRSHLANEALGQGQLQLGRERFAQERSQSQYGVLEKYNQLLNAGDYAGAEQLAPAMQRMGIHLQPLDQHVDAPSHQEWAQSQQAPEAPAQQAEIPQQAGPAPAPFLQEYMAGKGGAEERTEPVDNQAEEAAERVRSIGGDPSGIQAPPRELPQSRFSLPQQPQASGPLPVYKVIIDGQERGVIDPNKRAAQEKALAQRGADQFMAGVPERFRPLMQGAFQGLNTREELENSAKHGMATEGNAWAAERAQQAAEAMGVRASGTDHRNAVRRIDALVKQEYDKTQDQRAKMNTLASTLGMLATDNSVAARVALAQTTKALFGAAQSDRELGLIMNSDGRWTQLEMKLNEWTQGGALPENFVQDLQEANKLIHETAEKYIRLRGETTADIIRNDPDIDYELGPSEKSQYAANAYSRITGAPVRKYEGGGQRKPQVSVSASQQTRTKGADPVTGTPTAPSSAPAKPKFDLKL